MKRIIFLLVIIFFTGCKKISAPRNFTIKGQILESSSNPVPVSGYELRFYQRSIDALLGGVSGFDKIVKTGNDGKFVFKYSSGENFGFVTGGTNDNTINITGIDTIKYNRMYPEWYLINALTDVDLSRMYLFKKINQLVRKVQFNSALNTGEILEVITTDSSGASYKNIFGPVAAGTLITVDTIINCKLSRINVATKEYVLSAVLKKPSYQKNLSVIMPPGDETYREILMTY